MPLFGWSTGIQCQLEVGQVIIPKRITGSAGSVVLLTAGIFSVPAFADTGHCNYGLYSKALGYSLQVCQTARKVEQCGRLLQRDYDHSRAHAVRRKGHKIEWLKGDCSTEAVVGVCTLPHSRIFFYEGEAETLAVGCDRMKGRWDVKRL